MCQHAQNKAVIMKQFTKSNKSNYPLYILKTYGVFEQQQLSSEAIDTKNYDDLKHILNSMDGVNAIMLRAIKKLDIDAAKLILTRAEVIGSYLYNVDDTIERIFEATMDIRNLFLLHL